MKDGLHWDAKAGHGDGLSGAARDRVVMFAGTGSTTGWEGWLARGRRTHMREVDEWNLDKERIRHSGDFMDTLDKREDSDQTDLEDWDKEE